MQHRGKHFTEDTLTHITMAVSETWGFKYYQVTLRLFQITESESFHLKAVEENPPTFTALLLFKAWHNLKCKILFFSFQNIAKKTLI